MTDLYDLEKFNVSPDRPPSLDERGFRLFVIPAKVKGYYRKRRNWVFTVLVLFFLLLPWTKYAGQQTVLLDIVRRKFVFFGHTYFSHDGPFLFFFFAFAAFSLVFVTSIFGRIWCGWACPQTVFIDFIYRKIEEWTEGNHLERRKLGKEPWTIAKVRKRVFKWVFYFLVSAHIAHSFTAYFVGAEDLVWITLEPPTEHLALFIFVQVFTLITLFNFGWFREQFCLIVCPYGRFQSALMDQNSLAILYDPLRGEPRRKKGQKESGDCIDCKRCVNVCPTGIDIRNGLQMECIACTSCADACDEVMEKIGKSRGLIRYSSLNEMQGLSRKIFSGRVIGYLVVLIALVGGFVTTLGLRPDVEVKVIRAIDAPYQVAGGGESGELLNHFRFHITNQGAEVVRLVRLKVENPEMELITPQLESELQVGEERWFHVFVKFPKGGQGGKQTQPWTLIYEGEERGELKGEFVLVQPL